MSEERSVVPSRYWEVFICTSCGELIQNKFGVWSFVTDDEARSSTFWRVRHIQEKRDERSRAALASSRATKHNGRGLLASSKVRKAV